MFSTQPFSGFHGPLFYGSSFLFVAALALPWLTRAMAPASIPGNKTKDIQTKADASLAHATFAGGCFWCMEPPFEKIKGVHVVLSGYSGGDEKNPAYDEVSRGSTGHTETVDILYDPKMVSYATLLETFWRSMDPTDAGGQFADRGRQYRPVIFARNGEQKKLAEESKKRLMGESRFKKPVIVPIESFKSFYPAEDYHQDFYKKDPARYYAYRRGSGRQGFLGKTWGKDTTGPLIPVNPANDGQEDGMQQSGQDPAKLEKKSKGGPSKVYTKPPLAEIKRRLTSQQFDVTQGNGTERPFANEFWDHHEPGIYVDIVTGEPLFSSKDKFNSGTGWPSFTQPLDPAYVVDKGDASHGMRRTEVRSHFGDSHLGHVFEDGPAPTGLRYCINSAALRFIPKEKLSEAGYGDYAGVFAANKP